MLKVVFCDTTTGVMAPAHNAPGMLPTTNRTRRSTVAGNGNDQSGMKDFRELINLTTYGGNDLSSQYFRVDSTMMFSGVELVGSHKWAAGAARTQRPNVQYSQKHGDYLYDESDRVTVVRHEIEGRREGRPMDIRDEEEKREDRC